MNEEAGDTPCVICGHEAKHHNATVSNKRETFVIEGCCIIEVAHAPYPPYTMESIEAGQHKPCRCNWDGKTKQ